MIFTITVILHFLVGSKAQDFYCVSDDPKNCPDNPDTCFSYTKNFTETLDQASIPSDISLIIDLKDKMFDWKTNTTFLRKQTEIHGNFGTNLIFNSTYIMIANTSLSFYKIIFSL